MKRSLFPYFQERCCGKNFFLIPELVLLYGHDPLLHFHGGEEMVGIYRNKTCEHFKLYETEYLLSGGWFRHTFLKGTTNLLNSSS